MNYYEKRCICPFTCFPCGREECELFLNDKCAILHIAEHLGKLRQDTAGKQSITQVKKDNPSHKKMLNEIEAADFLGMKVATLRVWRCTRRVELPYFKIGKSIRYRIEDLTIFVETRRIGR